MDKAPKLSRNDCRGLFRDTTAWRAMNPAVVEKNFRDRRVLRHAFANPALASHVAFKGGTPLLKMCSFRVDIPTLGSIRLPWSSNPDQDTIHERAASCVRVGPMKQ